MWSDFIGYFLAILVGISLGLIGSGGSILTVPILVYILAIEPLMATLYSLFIVGTTSLVGGIQNALQRKVDFKTVFIFGIPSIASVYFTRAFLLPIVPDKLFTIAGFEFTKPIALMVLFAIVMIAASIAMIKPCVNCNDNETKAIQFNYPMILLNGIFVGILTGLVGAGGGFLIIPSLVFFAKMPIKAAVGTSLFIISMNALLGFAGSFQQATNIDWLLLLSFSALSVIGIFIGIFLSKRMDGSKLKSIFGWFVLLMGMYILIKELTL